MLGTNEDLALAAAFFVGGHFLLSSLRLRRALVANLGENGFRAAYSLVALVTLLWTIAAYRSAPFVALWEVSHELAMIPAALMPFAAILAAAGLTSRNVTMVGGEAMATDPRPARGIVTITRHPFLWGVVLWSASHLVVNGDVASVILFGALGLLAAGGMLHIDYRRRVTLGADWGPIAMASSVIPFLAAMQGRTAIDWRGIGWPRILGGIALYIALFAGHEWISGVPVLPQLASLLGR